MSFKVNVYDPKGQTYAPRIKHEDWERHRLVISHLHAAKTPRKVMLRRLRDDHDFRPTLGQLQAKCKEWNLKVYAKDATGHGHGHGHGHAHTHAHTGKSSYDQQQHQHQHQQQHQRQHQHRRDGEAGVFPKVTHSPAYYMASESGFIEEWSDDYRVHPALVAAPSPSSRNPPHMSPHMGDSSDVNSNNGGGGIGSASFTDRSLPPEYTGGGLLANSADSHWPIPDDERQCATMLHAAHYYHAVCAFQQAFSIYRAVYLYQRRQHAITTITTANVTRLVTTVLRCCCAAVTEHQRNIMHSVLRELGADPALDAALRCPLLVDCLQSAALSLISSDAACDVDERDMLRARANAYMLMLTRAGREGDGEGEGEGEGEEGDGAEGRQQQQQPPLDLQGMLYRFEHALLMQEHETRVLQRLLNWCEIAAERLHHEMDDIFVGYTICEEEYCLRIAQVFSGYLLSQWLKQPFDHDDPRLQLMQTGSLSHPVQLKDSTAQILTAVAFMVVNAIQCDPLAAQFGKANSGQARLWFLDAAKLFKRGTRLLCRLDERSRCALFADAFLDRFYTSFSYRQRSYRWAAQLPAIVDSVGIYLAQQSPWISAPGAEAPAQVADMEACSGVPHDRVGLSIHPKEAIESDPHVMQDISHDILLTEAAESPRSECNSITSFVNTYRRTLKRKDDAKSKSGASSPGDALSLSSSVEFRFGFVTSGNSADTDSLWHILLTNEACAAVP